MSCVGLHGEPMLVEWDLNREQTAQVFRGHQMQRFVTGMATGGPGEALVCAGSDDGRIMLWHRQSGRLAKVLIGHQGCVNAISWCLLDGVSGGRSHSGGVSGSEAEPWAASPPTSTPRYLLASASDDHSVRIWGPRSGSVWFSPQPMQRRRAAPGH
jgi:WD40 repeat protein